MRNVRVALAQIAPLLGEIDANLTVHLESVREARRAGADLVVFPELSLTGYLLRDQVPEVALRVDAPRFRSLVRASRTLDLMLGFVEETPDHRYHNATAYLSRGHLVHVHRKVYLPTYGIFDEQRYLAAGGRIRAFDTALGRMAILICEDLWHPATAGIAAWDGAELILCPSASPGRGLGRTEPFQNTGTWERVIRAYGDLFTCFVVYANRVGYEDGACFWGGSEVVGPTGASLAKARYLEEDLLVVDVDAGALRRARVANPLLRDERLDLNLRELQRVIRAQGGTPEPAGDGPGG
jgi:predicted amidohydrolase